MTTAAERAAVRDDAIDILRPLLPAGSTVYTKVLSVSRSGMSRSIGCYIIVSDGGGSYIRDISGLVARATGNRYDDRNDGVTIPGVGMDMTFAIVYELGRALFPAGHRCTGSTGRTPTGKRSRAPRCPSNDHSNDYSRLANEYDREHPAESLAASSAAPNASGAVARTAYISARQEWIAEQEPRLWSKRRVHSDSGYALNRSFL